MRSILMMFTGVLLMQAPGLAQIKIKVGPVSVRLGGSRLKHSKRARPRIVKSPTSRIVVGRGGLLRHRHHTPVRTYQHGRLHHRSRGYWKIINEKVWVPPVYRQVYGRHGHRIRICVRAGYYTYVEKRIWVPAKHYHSHGRHAQDCQHCFTQRRSVRR